MPTPFIVLKPPLFTLLISFSRKAFYSGAKVLIKLETNLRQKPTAWPKLERFNFELVVNTIFHDFYKNESKGSMSNS